MNKIHFLLVIMVSISFCQWSKVAARADTLATWSQETGWSSAADGLRVNGDGESYTIANEGTSPLSVSQICTQISVGIAPVPGGVSSYYLELDGAYTIAETEAFVSYEIIGYEPGSLDPIYGDIEFDFRPNSIGCRLIPFEIGVGETATIRFFDADPSILPATVESIEITNDLNPMFGFGGIEHCYYQANRSMAVGDILLAIEVADYFGTAWNLFGQNSVSTETKTFPLTPTGTFRTAGYQSGHFPTPESFTEAIGNGDFSLSLDFDGTPLPFRLDDLGGVKPAPVFDVNQTSEWIDFKWEASEGQSMQEAIMLERWDAISENGIALTWEAIPGYPNVSLQVLNRSRGSFAYGTELAPGTTSVIIPPEAILFPGGSPSEPFMPIDTIQVPGRDRSGFVITPNNLLLEVTLTFAKRESSTVISSANQDATVGFATNSFVKTTFGLVSQRPRPTATGEWIDPPVSIGYDYEVISGPKFSSVTLPAGNCDGNYFLEITDPAHPLFAQTIEVVGDSTEVSYDFTAAAPGGVLSFRITGIEPGAEISPENPSGFPTNVVLMSDDLSRIVMTPIPYELAITAINRNPAGGFDLKWNSIIGEQYRVLGSAELGAPWVPIETVTASSISEMFTANPPVGASMYFWRIEQIPCNP